MATAMPIIKEDKKLPESGIKCRQCRSGFLIEVVDSEKSESFTSTTDLYLINEEDLPNWVSEKVEEAGWTKGRLNCPKCQCRVGGFDFVNGSENPVHFVKSKVDYWKKFQSQHLPSEAVDQCTSLSDSASNSPISLTPVSSKLSSSNNSCTSSSSSSSSSMSSMSSSTETRDSLDETSDDPEIAQVLTSHKRKRRLRHRIRRKINGSKDRIGRERRKQQKKEKLIKKILDAEPELDDLDASLICPVCLDLLFDPFSVIPCKHTFCETCLRRIGNKDPMNTFCPMCRQRVVYCENQSELAMSIRESYSELYKKRKTSEKSTNVYELPLPWRPGWRNLVSGRALGGNPLGASTLFDYLKTIVQLLPYYVPPVVIANLINMIFFFVLLGAVEILPFISGFFQRPTVLTMKTVDNKQVQHFNMGITPNTFLNAISRQLCGEDEDVLMMLEGAHLPPTYLPPESTQAMDATFYYVVCGMAILAAAFGQLIWNLDD